MVADKTPLQLGRFGILAQDPALGPESTLGRAGGGGANGPYESCF